MIRLFTLLLLLVVSSPTVAVPHPPVVQAYFGPAAADDPDGLFLNLIRFLDSAESSIHASIHEIDMIAVAEKFAEQAARGLDVRLVVEADWWTGQKGLAAREILNASRVRVIPDTRKSGLMHNKFIIADGKRVWTGSTNLTQTCLFFNPNNAVWVEDRRVASNFETEFREQEAGLFGKKASGPPNTPYPILKVERGAIETYFGPEDEPLRAVIRLITEAKHSVEVMCFVFSSAEVGDALREAHERGVRVRVLLDNAYSSDAITRRWRTVPFKDLTRAGVACKYDDRRSKLHHKCVIVDRLAVVTGSMNLSTSGAEINDENLLIIRLPEIGKQFSTEFERLWKEYPGNSRPEREDRVDD